MNDQDDITSVAISLIASLRISSCKFNIGKTYESRQPPELKLAQKAYTDAAQIIESQQHRADLLAFQTISGCYNNADPDRPAIGAVLGRCYVSMARVSYLLKEWETTQDSATKGIDCLKSLNIKNDIDWQMLSFCHKILGQIYLHQYKTRQAREAFFSAISNRCNIVCGIEEDFLKIVEYSRLMSGRTTYFNNNLTALCDFVERCFGNYGTVDYFLGALDEAIASPSNLDKEAFSYVLLPFAKFISSNQNNPHF